MTTEVEYTANGSSSVFPFPFAILTSADCVVLVNGVIQSSGYSVRGQGSIDGGAIVFDNPPATGQVITLRYLGSVTVTAADSSPGQLADKLVAGGGIGLAIVTGPCGGQQLRITASGSSGALMRSANLSDLDDVATARTNLGLGTLATASSVGAAAIAMTGPSVLGRTDAGAGAAAELSLSQVLDLVGGATPGDLLYRGASEWQRLPAGSPGQVLLAGGSAGAPAWGSIAVPSYAGGYRSLQVFAASGVFEVPEGVTELFVEVIGGGGASAEGADAAGGAGGGYASRRLSGVVPGSSIAVTVGAGGVFPQGQGGTSAFGTLFQATGGGGGGTVGGFGATGGVGSGGDINLGGDDGYLALGGGAPFGGGTRVCATDGGHVPGGGASGGLSDVGPGGDGARGEVRVYW